MSSNEISSGNAGRRFGRWALCALVLLMGVFYCDHKTPTGPVTSECPHWPPSAPVDSFDPGIRIISPNGGEMFHIGEQCTVRVTSRLPVSAAVLHVVIGRYILTPPPFDIMATSLQGIPAVDTVVFAVPDSFSETGGGMVNSISDSCLLQIFDYSHPQYLDYSDCYFKIRIP
jgi:hypothetical protein